MNFVDTEDYIVDIAQIITRCPTITIKRALTRAYRDWACQTQYLRVAVTGETEANTRQYSLGSDTYQEIVAIIAMQGWVLGTDPLQIFPLRAVDSALWNPNMPPTQPLRYTYVPQAQFALDPIPDQAYGLTITAIVQPKENAASIPDAGLIKYRAGIEAGAKAYLHSLHGQPWSDPVKAEVCRREFQSSINNARAEVARGFNTGAVYARPKRFVR